MTVTFETIDYAGWQGCTRVHNGLIDVVVPASIGIRVMRFGFAGEANQFLEVPAHRGQTGGDEWRIYGGHRLWHAPETRERTYSRDNSPVYLQQQSHTLVAIQPTDHAGIAKQLSITLRPGSAAVKVLHTLTNAGLWPVTLAPWALSVMANGGTAVVPLPPHGSHETELLPNTRLVLWPYSDMRDPRWTWGSDYILLRHDGQTAIPQKFGIGNVQGWAAHWNAGTLFAKRAAYAADAAYPDFGSSFEFFTNRDILEVESLGPLTVLEPGASIMHAEEWHLWRDVPAPSGDEDVRQHIAPLIGEWA